jgi:hypothetical protein
MKRMATSSRTKSFLSTPLALGASVWLAACQGQKFSGKNGQAAAPAPTQAAQAPKTTPTKPGVGTTVNDTWSSSEDAGAEGTPAPGMEGSPKPASATATDSAGTSTTVTTGATGVSIVSGIDAEAIRKCLNLWGTHPFKNVTQQNFKQMAPNVALFGIEINPVEDFDDTSFDKLVLIDVSFKIASTVNMKLMNPRGWYCVKADISSGVEGIPNTTNVSLACGAKLAKNDLSIGVNSQTGGVTVGSQSLGQLGIAIDSTVTLTRKNKNGTACAN